MLVNESLEIGHLVLAGKCGFTVSDKYFKHLASAHLAVGAVGASLLVVPGGSDEHQFQSSSVLFWVPPHHIRLICLHHRKVLPHHLEVYVGVLVALGSHYFLVGPENVPVLFDKVMDLLDGIVVWLVPRTYEEF